MLISFAFGLHPRFKDAVAVVFAVVDPAVHRIPEIGELKAHDHVGVADHCRPRREMVSVREVHPVLLVHHRHLNELCELYQQINALLGARHTVRDDDRVLRIDKKFCRLTERSRIGVRRRCRNVARRVEAVSVLLLDAFLLEAGVERNHHRPVRRRHRVFVGAHERLREVLERDRLVVPFGEVAHQRVDVLRGVDGRRAGRTLGGIEVVAADHDERHAVGPGVIDRHAGVLQADGAVHQRHLRLAGGFEMAVAHRHRRLFVRDGQEFRHGVPAVIDQRLMQAAEARCRIGIDILDLQRFDDVDHEVGGRAARDLRRRLAQAAGLGRDLMRGGHHRRGQPFVHGCAGARGLRAVRNGRRRRRDGGAGQEFSAAYIGARLFACHSRPP